MELQQVNFSLPSYRRGFHLITHEITQKIKFIPEFTAGVLQLFILHTSASISINENADSTVRLDFETHFNKLAPENQPYYLHNDEGSDDMPAHLKSSLLGCSVLVPIQDGKLKLGNWQGIYLGEHRNQAEGRNFTATLWGNR